MNNIKQNISDSDKEEYMASPNVDPIPDDGNRRLISLEKELVKKDREIESLQRIHNSTSVELLETNKAIALLARKYEKISQDKELEIARELEENLLQSILSLKEVLGQREIFQIELDIVISKVRSIVRKLTHGADSFNQLTPTEMRVAVLIKNGETSQQIADRLFISESTVKTHRKRIRNKLGIQNRKLNLASYLNKIM